MTVREALVEIRKHYPYAKFPHRTLGGFPIMDGGVHRGMILTRYTLEDADAEAELEWNENHTAS